MAADKEFPFAIITLASMYALGECENVNKEEAFKYTKMAAECGHVPSICDYGIMLRDGYYADADENLASECFLIASNKGSSKGMFLYGEMLEKRGSQKDIKEAAMFYKMSADNGNKEAMIKYSNMLKTGKGVEKNEEECKKYEEMAAQERDPQVGIECLIC